MNGRRVLAAGGVVAGGLFVRAVYRSSVAFPRAVRAAAEAIQADIKEIREHAAEVERVLTEAGVPRNQWRSEWLIPPRIRDRSPLL